MVVAEDGPARTVGVGRLDVTILLAADCPANLAPQRSAPSGSGAESPWGAGRGETAGESFGQWLWASTPRTHTLPRIRSESPAFDLHHPDFESSIPGKEAP